MAIQQQEGAFSDFHDKPFALLVKHFMEIEGSPTQSYLQLASKLPSGSELIADKFISKWIDEALKPQFWRRATSEVCPAIIEHARWLFQTHSISFDNDDLDLMLNIAVLNFASIARDQPKVQTHMGIREESFPWASTLALLYPIGGAINMAVKPSTNSLIILGAGFANLAFAMLAAGIFSRTFMVFKLRGRERIFLAAVTSFVVGAILLYMGDRLVAS